MVHIRATVGTEPREWNLVFSLFETPRRTFPEMAGLPAHAAGRLMMLADRQNRTTNRLEGERVARAWGMERYAKKMGLIFLFDASHKLANL